MVHLIRLILPILMAWLFFAQGVAADNRAAPLLTPPRGLVLLIEEGLNGNQELAAAASVVKALELESRSAGALPDPKIGLGLLNLPSDTFRFSQEPMTQKQLSITQQFPWFGKLDLRVQKAELKALKKVSQLNDQRVQLIRKISTLYYELGLVSENQRINEEMINLLDQVIRIAETRYASGKGLQQDVLQAHVEQSRLLDSRATLKSRYKTIENKLHRLLNRKQYMEILPVLLTGIPDIDLDPLPLKEWVITSHPMVKTRQVEIDLVVVGVKLAKKDYWPDPAVRLAYGQRDEAPNGNQRSDFVSASVSFSLPVWSEKKQDNRLAAQEKRHSAALSTYEQLINTLPHQVDEVVLELDTLSDNFKLYDQAILVQARQWADVSLSTYRVGKAGFSIMIDAQLRLLRLELMAKKYQYGYFKKLAHLDALMGGILLSHKNKMTLTSNLPDTAMTLD